MVTFDKHILINDLSKYAPLSFSFSLYYILHSTHVRKIEVSETHTANMIQKVCYGKEHVETKRKKENLNLSALCVQLRQIFRVHDIMTPQCADEIQPGSINPPGHDTTLSVSTPYCWVRMYDS